MIPDGWLLLPPDLAADAKHKAMEALRTDGAHPAQHRLARFYDADGDYAGASFAQLGPIDITPAGLLATTLLSVRIRPGAARRILDRGDTRDTLLRKLRDLPGCDLANAGSSALTAMEALYEAVKQALSADTVKNPNAWVTASKLCARKSARPPWQPRLADGCSRISPGCAGWTPRYGPTLRRCTEISRPRHDQTAAEECVSNESGQR